MTMVRVRVVEKFFGTPLSSALILICREAQLVDERIGDSYGRCFYHSKVIKPV